MQKTWQKLSFFTALYFVQGAAFAYAVNFQKPFLLGKGIDKETLGLLTSVLLLPFILKVFLGMLSDRVPLGRFGARKPYMLLGLAGFALCYFILSRLNPAAGFLTFAAYTFAASLCLALFDTCCDGWAIDIARGEEHSSIQAAMVGGRSVGYIVMSMAFGLLGQNFGFETVFITLSGLAVLMFALVALTPYKPLGGGQLNPGNLGIWREFRGWLTPAYILFAVYGVLYSVASFGTDGILTLHLADTRLSNIWELGLFGLFRGIGALVGAVAFVRSERRSSRETIMGVSLVLLGAGCMLPLLPLPIQAAGAAWGYAWGFQETAYVTVAMSFARGPWAATYFAMAMIFSNIGTALGEALAGAGVTRLGYPATFAGFGVLAWLLAFAMPRLFARFKL